MASNITEGHKQTTTAAIYSLAWLGNSPVLRGFYSFALNTNSKLKGLTSFNTAASPSHDGVYCITTVSLYAPILYLHHC